jgi:hypothetical protein
VKPNSGGTPAKENSIIKNNKLNGNIVPNFFKSLKLRIYRVSKLFNNKKNVKIKNMYVIKIINTEV